MVYKVNEGRPNCVDLIKSGQIDIIFNTPLGRESFYDDGSIRKSATQHGVLVVTTLTAAAATVQAIQALREEPLEVVSLQEIHEEMHNQAPLEPRGAAPHSPDPQPSRLE